MVVKPATAYNSLAQAVNNKFGSNWDGDSAKSRVRTMKSKFHNVFTLCGGNVSEETAVWKLSDADKRDGILTLADKALSMCPHWNSWLEWCGSDPNMSKHGTSDSGLVASISSGLSSEAVDVRDEDPGNTSSGDDCNESVPSDNEDANKGSLATFALQRQLEGDEGNKGNGEEEIPRALTLRTDRAPGDANVVDDLQVQKQKRRNMLAGMTGEEKKEFSRQEQKEKRQKEQEASANRRNAVASAACPSTGGNSPHTSSSNPSSSISSPFGKGGTKDWQASFLVDRAKDEDAKAEKQAAAQVAVVKLQIAAADKQYAAELEHKREQLSFQQQQLVFQQQQMQMQMQMKQSQQMM